MDFYTRGFESDMLSDDLCWLPTTPTFQSPGATDVSLLHPTFPGPGATDFDGFQKEVIQMVAFIFKDGVMIAASSQAIMEGDILKDGVMVAADSRASMEGDISSQYVKKIVEINPRILVPMAVRAADFQFWIGELDIKYCRHERKKGGIISVAEASKLLADILSSRRGLGSFLGTMIAGWDKGPELYHVNSERCVKGNRFFVGSGSPYADEVLDSGYDMPVEEAVELARLAIDHATFRYGASGGVTSVYHVGPNGWKKLCGDDVASIHFNYNPNELLPEHDDTMTYYLGPKGFKKLGDDPNEDAEAFELHSAWDPFEDPVAQARWNEIFEREKAETSAASGEMAH